MPDIKQSLERTLESLGGSTEFATSGRLPVVLPGLAVGGVEAVGFPLSAGDAKRLMTQARRAPYGRGDKTIVDTRVRRVWQMEPTQFSLRNSDWEAQIASIVDAVREAFGIGQGMSLSGRMLKLLEQIGDVKLAQRFLQDALPKDDNGSEGKSLRRLCQRLGWKVLQNPLKHFLTEQNPENYAGLLGHIVSICVPLCCDAPKMTEERRAVCLSLAEELIRLIERWDQKPPKHAYRHDTERVGVVDGVVHELSATGMTEPLASFLAHVLADSEQYDLRRVLVPDVKDMHRWLPKIPAARQAVSQLRDHCVKALRAATDRPIEPPKDWTRPANLGCDCVDCQALSRFLQDPLQEVGRFPLRKDRRQHFHQQIDRRRCDCTHVTERIGSPQTLVCTKTQDSYERRQAQFVQDLKDLDELESLAGPDLRDRPAAKKRKPRK